jgi:hypothetical protein
MGRIRAVLRRGRQPRVVIIGAGGTCRQNTHPGAAL